MAKHDHFQGKVRQDGARVYGLNYGLIATADHQNNAARIVQCWNASQPDALALDKLRQAIKMAIKVLENRLDSDNRKIWDAVQTLKDALDA